jgi:predicted amidohydrolase YtcJ
MALSVIVILMVAPAQAEIADTIYINGKIYTVNEKQLWVEAVAIKDGKFIAVGSNAKTEGHKGNETTIIDLDGMFVMPGIHDAHLHFESAYQPEMLGDKMMRLGPEHDSIEKIQRAIKEYADANPDIEILFIEQLPLSLFPGNDPTNKFIDEVVPDRAVVMYGDQEHEVVLNKKALEMEGITKDTPVPANGEIIKDSKSGEPTGLLKEEAAGKWGVKHYPVLEREKHKKGLKATIDYLLSVGITGGKQQHAKPPVATAFHDLAKSGELEMRIALSWTWRGPLEPMPLAEQEKTIMERDRYAHDLINVDFVKFSIDGVPGATGYVLEPYGVTGSHGLSFYEKDGLVADIAKFDAMGLGITTHSMGDAGTRLLLDALEEVKKKQGDLKGRHQLAHASLVHPDDRKRLKALNLTPEYSPVLWFPAPVVLGYAESLGQERLQSLWPMRSLHKAGARTVIGSDGPLFWQEPLTTLELAVTRKSPGDADGEALSGAEALDLATAIKGMTINAAYLLGFDQSSGSIESGKHADMIILDQNLFEIPEHKISATKLLRTVFGGKVVYDATRDPSTEKAIEKEHGVALDLTGSEGHRGCEWHHGVAHQME